jgi:hypothetical protein
MVSIFVYVTYERPRLIRMNCRVNNLFYVSYIESQRLIRTDFTKVLKDPGCRHEKYTQKKKNIKQDFNNYIYRIKNFVKYAFSPIFFSFVLSDT